MPTISISKQKQKRIISAFRSYWLSPFCSGKIEIGETLLAWALEAELFSAKSYADAYNAAEGIAYQFKTGLPNSPITFARLTTPSQFALVNSDDPAHCTTLGNELLAWVANRIQEPYTLLDAQEVRVARIIYTRSGDFIYYERPIMPEAYRPEQFTWSWSTRGNALEGHLNGVRWFSWYPQGRRNTKNQNQLHFHGENVLTPGKGSSNRIDFSLGAPAQIDFDAFIGAVTSLIDDL